MVQIHPRRSKGDQEGHGADIILCRHHRNQYLPSALHIRGSGPGPFFTDHKGRTATKTWFTRQVRIRLQQLGLPAHQYAGNSFRIGTATSAALAGLENSPIQTLGRWHSVAFPRYITQDTKITSSLYLSCHSAGPGLTGEGLIQIIAVLTFHQT